MSDTYDKYLETISVEEYKCNACNTIIYSGEYCENCRMDMQNTCNACCYKNSCPDEIHTICGLRHYKRNYYVAKHE